MQKFGAQEFPRNNYYNNTNINMKTHIDNYDIESINQSRRINYKNTSSPEYYNTRPYYHSKTFHTTQTNSFPQSKQYKQINYYNVQQEHSSKNTKRIQKFNEHSNQNGLGLDLNHQHCYINYSMQYKYQTNYESPYISTTDSLDSSPRNSDQIKILKGFKIVSEGHQIYNSQDLIQKSISQKPKVQQPFAGSLIMSCPEIQYIPLPQFL